jgi:hypothetical protein
MVPGISFFLRHFPFGLLNIRGKKPYRLKRKPDPYRNAQELGSDVAGDRYVTVGFSRGDHPHRNSSIKSRQYRRWNRRAVYV